MGLISVYPYLASQAVWILFSAAAFLILRRHARLLLIGGLLALPAALYEPMLIPEYWNPVRIFEAAGLGPEDLIFSFTTSVLALISSGFFFTGGTRFFIERKKLPLRLGICLFFGIGMTTFLHFLGAGKMWNPFLTMIMWAILLTFLKSFHWKTALTGAAGFGLLYTLGFKIQQAYVPKYLDSWAWENLSGVHLGGMPLEEIIWAVLYGGIWPLTVYFILKPYKNINEKGSK